MIKNLYTYRELLRNNIKKEIRGRYKGSILGILWSFINPLLQTLIYAFIFPLILQNVQDNYVAFLIIGVFTWYFFANTIANGNRIIINNANIINKIYFPREILPISSVTSGLVNYLISFPIILIFLLFSKIGFSIYILLVPLIILIEYILTLGIIFITSSITVYIRDFEFIVNFFINLLFYATPILYAVNDIPSKWQWLIKLNPITSIINSLRDILLYHNCPNILSLLLALISSLVILIIGIFIFRKLEKRFSEEL